ncbi:hypothetical protein Tco_0972843, partial [Tanacetum coccineum]
MKAFPLSLSKDAKNWWMNEGDGNISTWEELAKKFYPISCTSNYDKMCDNDEEGRNPLEFIPWRNSKDLAENYDMHIKHPNERTPSPPPRNKSLSPPQAPSKSISSKSTHYTSSSSPSKTPTQIHVAPPPKLRFVIPIKLEPQELTPPQMSPNDPYAQAMDNWPSGPSYPSPPPRVSRPPPGFPNPPPKFEPLLSTQPLFVNINNNIPLLHNNAPPLENIHHPPPNLGNQDFPNPPNILYFVHPNDMPHLHNMFCQCCSTTRHEIQKLQNYVNYINVSIRNSKFKDHKKVDETTKCALLYTWIEIRKEEGLLNDEVSSDEEWEEQEYGNPPKDSFPKPYFEMDKNNHNENNRNTYKSS